MTNCRSAEVTWSLFLYENVLTLLTDTVFASQRDSLVYLACQKLSAVTFFGEPINTILLQNVFFLTLFLLV